MSQHFREQLLRWIRRQPRRATPRVPMANAVDADAASYCPLPDCSTCEPLAPPLDVAAELERASEINRAAWWLVTAYPDVWYFEDPKEVRTVAARLVALRTRVAAGRVAR